MNAAPAGPQGVLPESTLGQDLKDVWEARALMCVTVADEAVEAATAVEAALGPLSARYTVVNPPARGGRGGFVDALYAALHLERRSPRPHRLAEAEDLIEDELARRSPTLLLVREAQLLDTASLQVLYMLWTELYAADRACAVVLTGPERLRTVLRRPALDSLRSSIFIWHRLES